MTSIYEQVAEDLFRKIDELQAQTGRRRIVSLAFVELAGDRCSDMLNAGRPAQLLTGRDGGVQPYPVVEASHLSCAGQLLALIRHACALRATEATGVHDHSSRSHAVCRIYVADHGGGGGGGGGEGLLQLVDLAGSEHRIDSAEHSAARRKEGAQINSSLAALKECIRARAAAAAFVPYRKSKLTLLLKACFAEGSATCVIATVSPASKDTEHSLNTLRHACIMDGQGDGGAASAAAGGSSHIDGGRVEREDVGALDVTAMARERRAQRQADADAGGPGTWSTPPPPPAQSEAVTAAEAVRRREKAVAAAERRAIRELAGDVLTVLGQVPAGLSDSARRPPFTLSSTACPLLAPSCPHRSL